MPAATMRGGWRGGTGSLAGNCGNGFGSEGAVGCGAIPGALGGSGAIGLGAGIVIMPS